MNAAIGAVIAVVVAGIGDYVRYRFARKRGSEDRRVASYIAALDALNAYSHALTEAVIMWSERKEVVIDADAIKERILATDRQLQVQQSAIRINCPHAYEEFRSAYTAVDKLRSLVDEPSQELKNNGVRSADWVQKHGEFDNAREAFVTKAMQNP
ncbi:hypothetical protein L0F81_29305 [Streptomyces tricolor]|uniref:Secreted protein n=1 Tax=Streptomyces tricolor TaxID=68277 RepID=A0ABS9JPA0_9ACTN|nr:hypothetical protein [Streptomyces tricolor]MCG0067319.1 hypothetical protein [Streptomyces tricolor]